MNTTDELRVISIAEGARIARMTPTRTRVFLGVAEGRMPVYSWLGHVIVDMTSRPLTTTPKSGGQDKINA